MFAWGMGSNGQCGQGSPGNYPSPQVVDTKGLKISAVACGVGHTIVIAEDGNLLSCGWNHCGQLGLGDHKNRHPNSNPDPNWV